MPTVFVYGALMGQPVARERGRAAWLSEHAVRFLVRGMPIVEPRFATVVPAPGEQAHGIVMDLSDDEWSAVLAGERGYAPVPSRAHTADGDVDCLALVAEPDSCAPEQKPSARYARLLADAGRFHRLPDSVVARYEELTRTGAQLSTRLAVLKPAVVFLVPYIGFRRAVYVVLGGLVATAGLALWTVLAVAALL